MIRLGMRSPDRPRQAIMRTNLRRRPERFLTRLCKGRAKDAAHAAATVVEPDDGSLLASKGIVTVSLELRGGRSVAKLVDKLSEIHGVSAVNAGEAGLVSD
jgi:hypothetical protein